MEKLKDIEISLEEKEMEMSRYKAELEIDIDELKRVMKVEAQQLAEVTNLCNHEKARYDVYRRDYEQKIHDLKMA